MEVDCLNQERIWIPKSAVRSESEVKGSAQSGACIINTSWAKNQPYYERVRHA